MENWPLGEYVMGAASLGEEATVSGSLTKLISYPDLTLSLEMGDLVKFDSTPFFIGH